MRTISLSGGGITGTASVPDAIVYAFNQNYVTLAVGTYTGVLKLGVSDGTNNFEIDVSVLSGTARCYVSRLLQLLFTDYVTARSKSVTITIKTNSGTTMGSAICLVLWAAVEPGMTYGYYLPVVSDVYGGGEAKRDVVWFTAFPFTVSVFNASTGISDVAPGSVTDTNIRIKTNGNRVGRYLRWIDGYGFMQYYLFDLGTRSSKNKLSSTLLDAEYTVAGVTHYAQRANHVQNTDTIKCCASNLPKEILAYVETIYKSPHIELYMGNSVWKPVNIDDGTVTVNEKDRLFDYEISITLPDTQVQTI